MADFVELARARAAAFHRDDQSQRLIVGVGFEK
jgi:hypothetical protein